MKTWTVPMATTALWIVLVVVIGYWRMFYTWQLGSVAAFLFHYIPILILILIVLLSLEAGYFRWRR